MIRPLLLLLLLAPGPGLADGPLGRLFFTPDERIGLNYLRQVGPAPKQNNETDTIPLSASVSVQGYVQRSDGRGTVWINHQALQETSAHGGVKVGRLSNGRVRLTLTGQHKEVVLKAGQSYDPMTGAVADRQLNLPLADLTSSASPDDRTRP